MTLAIDLASRGVSSHIIEIRREGDFPSVKCNHVAARSMEIFSSARDCRFDPRCRVARRLSQDVSYRTTTTGVELARIRIPVALRNALLKRMMGPTGGGRHPSRPTGSTQIYLEPILARAVAGASADLNKCIGPKRTGFTQEDSGVTVKGHDLDTGESFSIKGDFLIGCDGGRSPTRHAIWG